MRAALVEAIGATPVAGHVPEPDAADGEVVVELAAAALNPVDLAVASGSFYAGHPLPPYVPAVEGAGRVGDALVYVSGAGLGIVRNGTASERFAAPESALIHLPEAADPAVAAALGTAGLAGWLPLSWRAPVNTGETVLVLGATGTAGGVAVQAARLLGAGKVVAAGRNRDRLEALGDLADEVVAVDEPELSRRLAEACEPGADLIYDLLWGEPLAAAIKAARPGGRIVHVGASAGQSVTLPSIRGMQLSILGYSNFAVPRDVLVDAYLTLVRHAMEGSLTLDVQRVALEDVGVAWDGLRSGRGKYVLVA